MKDSITCLLEAFHRLPDSRFLLPTKPGRKTARGPIVERPGFVRHGPLHRVHDYVACRPRLMGRRMVSLAGIRPLVSFGGAIP